MKQELLRIYTKYKKQIFPMLLIFLSLFIVFRVILPQFSTISETNLAIESKKQELAILNNSIRVLESINNDALSQDLALSTNALPTSKDITKIFNALISAARESKTELGEFSLKVGGVFGKKDFDIQPSAIGIPELSVVARVSSSDASSPVIFAQILGKTLPLSEIKKINADSNSGAFDISFYYKPLDQNLILKKDEVVPLSQADRKILNQLVEWNRN